MRPSTPHFSTLSHTTDRGSRSRLSIWVAFACSAAFSPLAGAQDTTEINQIGEMNSATIEQVDVSPAMNGYIAQDGEYNTASIYQAGPIEEEMLSEITQDGSFNEAQTEQQRIETRAVIHTWQSGTDHVSVVTQTDSINSYASTEQSGESHTSYIHQESYFQSQAQVTQAGQANASDISQTGYPFPTSATVVQDGEHNSVRIRQGREGYATALVQQFGANNTTEVEQNQFTAYGEISARLATEGEGNHVFVEQRSTIGHIELFQSGDYNTFNITHGGEAFDINITATDSNHNSDLINQGGITGDISIERYASDNNTATIYQRYQSPSITIQQTRSDGMHLNVFQDTGFFDSASIVQTDSAGSTAVSRQEETYEATAVIEQSNTSNSIATISQYGEEGTPTDYFEASILQSGGTDLSYAEIEQTNMGNSGTIIQSGAINAEAIIVQTGISATAEITQMSMGSSAPNTATITQAGEGYSATIHQTGGGNDAVVAQM